MNIINRLPHWLYSALNLQDAEIPNALDTDSVLSVVDVGQGGWMEKEWVFESAGVAPSTGAGIQPLLLPLDSQGRLLFLSALHTGGAGSVDLGFQFSALGIGGPMRIAQASNVAVGSHMAHTAITGSSYPIIIPPGAQLDLAHPGTAVGESFTIFMLSMKYRAGFKPI